MQPQPQTQPQTQPATGDTSAYGEFGGKAEYGGARLDYTKKVYNDWWAMVLFYLHAVVLIVMAIIVLGQETTTTTTTTTFPCVFFCNSSTQSVFDDEAVTGFYLTLLICAVVGILFGLIWLQIMKMFAEQIIKGMLFFAIICWILFACLGIYWDLLGIIVIGLIMAAFMGLYTYCVWGRIPFSSVLLTLSSMIASTYSGTIVISLLTCLFDIIWLVIWIFGFSSYTITAERNGEDLSSFVVFLYLISYYWGFYVIANVSHTTTCGVAATWYFSAAPHKPTQAALKRTMTTSFGSVCFGSLVVAIIRALRAMVESRGGRGSCLAACLLACLERLIQYFNTYAFAQVAIYGSPFIEAAKATWNLFLTCGIKAVINDDLTGLAIKCGAFFSFLVCAVIGYFVGDALTNGDITLTIIAAILGTFIGFGLCLLVLQVVRSGIIALFVCFAEDPAALSRVRPEAYQRLVDAHEGMRIIGSGQVYTTA